MPALAAVDPTGMGGSDKPDSGYDKKSLAAAIHLFVRALGYDQDIAGHDIGPIVAFSFAGNYREATRKVALMDVIHPNESRDEIRLLHIPGSALVNPDAVDERGRAIFAQRSDPPEGIHAFSAYYNPFRAPTSKSSWSTRATTPSTSHHRR